MSKIILTVGASSSGKSSWAEAFTRNRDDWVNINRDDIRFVLFNNGVRDWTKYKFSNANEKRVTDVQDEKANLCVEQQKNIIISDTNINPEIRDKWLRWAEVNGYEYEEKLFREDWETLVKRNAQRSGGLSESLLWDQYVRFERQFGDVKLYEEEFLDHCIICDIDGTIASMEGRKPFDWGRVLEDKLRFEILLMVEAIGSHVNHIVFLSGRDSVCRKETEQWLWQRLDNSDYTWELHMRTEGDNRKDAIIKDELYEKYIRGNYNVSAVFDDRRQMIRHWTLKGMPNIIDVGNYNEEF